MIYTVTFNPSIDYVVSVDNMRLGEINRTTEETIYPGGKGINVSIILKNLGVDNCALGFVAGFTGDEVVRRLRYRDIKAEFVYTEAGMTRINVKVNSDNETGINGIGPVIDEGALIDLSHRLNKLTKGDIIVIAGSVPAQITKEIYDRMLNEICAKGVDIVIDSERDKLTDALSYRPFLVKPNNYELGDIFGVELKTRQDVLPYAKKLQEMGARNVLVSVGPEGAVLVAENGKIYEAKAPAGKVINTVGAGDSMVAGFIAGYVAASYDSNKDKYANGLKLGVSAGTASACSEWMASRNEIMEILDKAEVAEL